MNEPVIAINNLTVSYHQRPVLRGVTAHIPSGSVTGIVGPNGAGKSTLMKAVLGLIPFDTGEITVGGKPVQQQRDRIAYIPQNERIDWDFPVVVRDVVMMGRYRALGWFRRPGPIDHQRVERTLQEVGMDQFAARHIRLLSGGQQQRVFIARALVQQADILLLDEPFAGVDAATQATIFTLIDRLKQEGRTIVMISHDLGAVKRLDMLLLLNQQVVAFGPPAQVFTEENLQRTYGGRMPMTAAADLSLQEAVQ